MTRSTALAKARMIWGKNAIVEDTKKQTIINGIAVSERFKIGRAMLGMFFSVEADGQTWEAAFDNYEARQERERQRMAKLKAEQPSATHVQT